MRKQDIRPGVVYAWQRSAAWEPVPVVFLAPLTPSNVWRERDLYNRSDPAFRPSPGDKPGRAGAYGVTTGYPVVFLVGVAHGHAPDDLLTVTLADFAATDHAYDRGWYRFGVETTLARITGPWAEVKTAWDAKWDLAGRLLATLDLDVAEQLLAMPQGGLR